MKKINTIILGASGYTGAELIRLLVNHPNVNITALSADRKAGKKIGDIFPHLSISELPILQKIEDINFESSDLVFCALPHGLTQEVIINLPRNLKVIDLSADFRLKDHKDYEYWYKKPHQGLELQDKFVYGLSEFYRDEIKDAQYIANTGCYVASSLLALLPILNMINTDNIIIDAKSGVTGAGRSLKENLLFCEISGGFSAYGLDEHRHSGEINQELSVIAKRPVKVRFSPHLIPQNRCILSTIYVDLNDQYTAKDLYIALDKRYKNESFVHVMDFGNIPQTNYVKGSNYTMIGVCDDKSSPNKAKIICVLDNLLKGASGQAIQNMNIMHGFDETKGLEAMGLFP